ncbi:hypothetical protein Tco_0583632 [Tanacetum coccineum]
MRNQADSKRREVTFQGLCLLENSTLSSLAKRRYEKLSPRFFGPYPVKCAIGPVAYELELPDDAKIHPVFHVSPGSKPFKPLLGSRSGSTGVLELLVSWNQRPLGEATWETYDLLPEDKAFYRGGSNDTNMRVYTRKKTRVKADDQEEQLTSVSKFLIDNHEYNDPLRKTRLGKMRRK